MTSSIVSDYVMTEISTLDSVPKDEASTMYVINTEFLKDIFKVQLTSICLNPVMARDDDVYSTYTDHIFCVLVEISLFIIANSGNDISDVVDVVDVVLGELYEDRTCIGDVIITNNDIKKTELMYQIIQPIYMELEKHLSMLPKKTDNALLTPLSWSYPDYRYLAVGEFS